MFHPYYFNCYTYRKPKTSSDELPWLMPGLDNGLSMVALTGSGMIGRHKGEVSEELIRISTHRREVRRQGK